MEKNTALRYCLLRSKKSRKSNWMLVAPWPHNEELEPLLSDFWEMMNGLIFQALPRKTLSKYLPPSVSIRQPELGCMVANPLNQHHDDTAARKAACQLKESTDPEVRSHYKDACEYLKTVEYVPTMEAMRAASKKKELFRAPENEFEASIVVISYPSALEALVSTKLSTSCVETTGILQSVKQTDRGDFTNAPVYQPLSSRIFSALEALASTQLSMPCVKAAGDLQLMEQTKKGDFAQAHSQLREIYPLHKIETTKPSTSELGQRPLSQR